MGLISNLIKGMKGDKTEFKEKYKQAELEMKIAKTLEERQKSSNERELERYMKEQHEAKIKQTLDKIHDKQNKESWKSPNQVIHQSKRILHEDSNILKQKNIFKGNKNITMNKGGMFF